MRERTKSSEVVQSAPQRQMPGVSVNELWLEEGECFALFLGLGRCLVDEPMILFPQCPVTVGALAPNSRKHVLLTGTPERINGSR